MIFEEFFLKKKIDLAQLKDADPSLFDQFKSHYDLMGEKSFDHTKKYWFNKLRHSYPLSAEEETRLKELFKGEKAVEKSEAIATEVKTETALAKPSGFRPKFKAPVSTEKQEEIPTSLPPAKVTPSETTPVENAGKVKPAGFKPRFKPGVTKTPIAESGTDKPGAENSQEEPSVSVAKPSGFTPRFKAGLTKNTTTEEDKSVPETKNIADEGQAETPKSLGFKPRFKPDITKTIQTEEENLAATTENSNIEVPKTENVDISKPVGFKPRFKANQPAASINEEIAAEENSGIQEMKSEEDTTTVAKPLGFKPRFKAGQTKVVEEKTEHTESVVNEFNSSETVEAHEKKVEDQPSEVDTTAIKPLGFKPRFKPKNKNDE